MKLKRGSTSVRRFIFIADSASTTGAGLANLTHSSSGLVAWYIAGDLNNDVQITLATATLGTFTSGGFIAVDNTNMPGWYEIGIPNAAIDGGNEVAIHLRGAANMVPVNVYIELDAFDYQTATQPVNVTQFGGSNITAAAGIPEVKVASIANNAITANAIADNAIDTATFAAGATLPRVTLVDTCSVNDDMIDASTISAQVAADLQSAHGSGSWTTATGFATPTNITDAANAIRGTDNDTLKTLSEQIDGLSTGTGSGARTVTITVNDGTTVLQNARVRVVEGVNTYTGSTNASGVVVFNLDDATYTVSITKSGYTYTGTSLVVDGTETRTYSMTVVTVTPPDDPALCAVTIHVFDQYGADMSGQPVEITFVKWDTTATDTPPVLSVPPVQTTDADGLVSVNLFREAVYRIVYGNAPYTRRVDVTIPDAGTYTVEI